MWRNNESINRGNPENIILWCLNAEASLRHHAYVSAAKMNAHWSLFKFSWAFSQATSCRVSTRLQWDNQVKGPETRHFWRAGSCKTISHQQLLSNRLKLYIVSLFVNIMHKHKRISELNLRTLTYGESSFLSIISPEGLTCCQVVTVVTAERDKEITHWPTAWGLALRLPLK